MGTGLLGSEDLTAANSTTIYTVPAGTIATVTVNMCNRNTSNALIKIGVATTLTDADYIEYNFELTESDIIERTGIVLGAGQSVIVESSVSGVSSQVWGWEEAA